MMSLRTQLSNGNEDARDNDGRQKPMGGHRHAGWGNQLQVREAASAPQSMLLGLETEYFRLVIFKKQTQGKPLTFPLKA